MTLNPRSTTMRRTLTLTAAAIACTIGVTTASAQTVKPHTTLPPECRMEKDNPVVNPYGWEIIYYPNGVASGSSTPTGFQIPIRLNCQ